MKLVTSFISVQLKDRISTNSHIIPTSTTPVPILQAVKVHNSRKATEAAHESRNNTSSSPMSAGISREV